MRAIGTGTAPNGQYPKGQVVDLLEVSPGSVIASDADVLERGWVRALEPGEDPAVDPIQTAWAVVNRMPLANPEERAAAQAIGSHDRALEIVHAQDPAGGYVDPHAGREGTSVDWPYDDPPPVDVQTRSVADLGHDPQTLGGSIMDEYGGAPSDEEREARRGSGRVAVPEGTPAEGTTGGTETEPPGRNASRDAWVEYAQQQGIEVPEGASRDQIADHVEAQLAERGEGQGEQPPQQ